MRILRHKLTNCFQHKDVDIELKGNLIGIVGPIGSGKTNFVQTIGENIIGDFSVKKDRMITLGEKTGSIETTIEIAPGKTVTVFRALKGTKCELTYSDGTEPVIGADAVTAALVDLLGVDKTTMKNIVFVKQDELGALLYSRDAERERLAHQFFGIDRAVRCERLIGDWANKNLLERAVAGNLLQLSDRLKNEILPAITAAEKTIPELEAKYDSEALVRLQANIASFRTNEAVNRRNSERQIRTSQIEERIAKAEASLAPANADCEGLSVETVQNRLNQETEKTRVFNQRQAAEQAFQTAKQSAEAAAKVQPPCTHEFINGLDAEISELSLKQAVTGNILKIRENILIALEAHASTTCPVCISTIDRLGQPALVAELEKDRAVDEKLSHLPELRLRADNWRTSLKQWEVDQQKYGMRVETLKAQLAAVPTVDGPGEIEKWQKNLEMVRSLFANRDQLARSIADLHVELKAIPAPEPVPGVNLPEGFSLDAALVQVNEMQQAQISLSNVKNGLELHKKDRENLTASIAQIEADEAFNRSILKKRESVNLIRKAFSPDGAPRELVNIRVGRMEQKINDYLRMFGVPFTVKGAGGFSFEAIFPDKPGPIRILELSGGQKITMALAFRLASVETFSSSIGVLVLDEPSVYLDDETKAHFVEVFERLKEMAVMLNMQFIVVTHERSFLSCFDQIISFGDR